MRNIISLFSLFAFLLSAHFSLSFSVAPLGPSLAKNSLSLRRTQSNTGFQRSTTTSSASSNNHHHPDLSPASYGNSVSSVAEATEILIKWDRYYNPDIKGETPDSSDELREQAREAVEYLNRVAADQRAQDATRGRCMLGICASSTEEAIATLKSWVTGLNLPRGLLHGMDKDGVPIEIEGGVYIKYNTGGSLTFSQIRNSGMGFDALWKPGDALVEPYDGDYRGVYFQVELDDMQFRQYMLPLDTFL